MHRLQHNHRVELERIVSNVIEIVLQLLDSVFVALAIRIVDLRPAGDPRLHQMPEMIEWDFLLVALRAFDPFRAWSDQAHVAAQNVPELRQLIEPALAQPPPHSRNPRIAFARLNVRLHLAGGLIAHRPQLKHREKPILTAYARLPEQDRPSAPQPDS